MHSASQELGGRGIGARWPRWRSGFSVAPVRLPAPFGQGSGTWPGIRRAGLDEPGCCLHTPRPPRHLPIGTLAMSSLPEPPLRFRGLRCCVPGSVRWKHMTVYRFPAAAVASRYTFTGSFSLTVLSSSCSGSRKLGKVRGCVEPRCRQGRLLWGLSRESPPASAGVWRPPGWIPWLVASSPVFEARRVSFSDLSLLCLL